jgi:hypothetical protein
MKRVLENLLIQMLVISFAFPIQAFAEKTDDDKKEAQSRRKDNKERRRAQNNANSQYSAWDFMGSLSDMSSSFVGQYQQQQQQQQQQVQGQAETQEMIESMTIKTPAQCQQKPTQKSGLCMYPSSIFSACTLLPSRMPTNNLCKAGVDQSNYMQAKLLAKISRQNQETYEGGSTISNNEDKFNGLECMEKGKELLGAQLEERIKQIDDLKLKLKEADTAFTEKMDVVLDTMKKNSSLITGKEYTGDDNGKVIKPSEFFSDPSCKSVSNLDDDKDFSAGLSGFSKAMSNIGYKDGVDNVKVVLNEGKAIDKDIRKMAQKMARKVKNGTFMDAASTLASSPYTSTYNIKTSGAYTNFIADMTAESQEKLATINKDRVKIAQGVDQSLLDAVLDDDPSKLNDEIKNWTNKKQTECMKERFTLHDNVTASISQADNKISSASRNTKHLGEKIQEVLDNDEYSLDQKQAEIKRIEEDSGKAQTMYISLEQEVDGQRPGYEWQVWKLYSKYAGDCKNIWNSQSDFGQYSGKNIIQKAKNLQAQYRSAHDELINTFESKMIDRMINCGGSVPEVNVSTCNATSLSINSNANYCLKGAQACASSMNVCATKAKAVLKKVRQNLKVTTKAYNNEVTAYKKAQYQSIKTEIAKFKLESKQLNKALPGINFGLPGKLNIGAKKTYLGADSDIDPTEVKVLDYAGYLKEMDESLEGIKLKITEQNDRAIAHVGEKIANITSNYETEAARHAARADECDNAAKAYEQMVAKQNDQTAKDTAEKNEKIQAFCASASGFNAKPGCGNAEDLTDNAADVLAFLPSTDSGKLGEIREYAEFCNESSNSEDGAIASGPNNYTASTYCKKDAPGDGSEVCEEYNDRLDETKTIKDGGCYADVYVETDPKTARPAAVSSYPCVKERRVAASEAANAANLKEQREEYTSDMGEKGRFELCTARNGGTNNPLMKGMDSFSDMNDTSNPFASSGATR